jgi:hypothetical protein
MELNLKVKEICVLLTHGTDKIDIQLDMPTTFPEMKYPIHATIEARANYGVEYCEKVFKIKPKIVNAR